MVAECEPHVSLRALIVSARSATYDSGAFRCRKPNCPDPAYPRDANHKTLQSQRNEHCGKFHSVYVTVDWEGNPIRIERDERSGKFQCPCGSAKHARRHSGRMRALFRRDRHPAATVTGGWEDTEDENDASFKDVDRDMEDDDCEFENDDRDLEDTDRDFEEDEVPVDYDDDTADENSSTIEIISPSPPPVLVSRRTSKKRVASSSTRVDVSSGSRDASSSSRVASSSSRVAPSSSRVAPSSSRVASSSSRVLLPSSRVAPPGSRAPPSSSRIAPSSSRVANKSAGTYPTTPSRKSRTSAPSGSTLSQAHATPSTSKVRLQSRRSPSPARPQKRKRDKHDPSSDDSLMLLEAKVNQRERDARKRYLKYRIAELDKEAKGDKKSRHD